MAKKLDLAKQLGGSIQRGKMARFLPPEDRDEEDQAALEQNQKKEFREKKDAAPVAPMQEVKPSPPAAESVRPPAKKNTVALKKSDDKKIPFMTYLDKGNHRTFEHLYLDVRTDARSATGKALSQSEMIEVLIEYVSEKTKQNTGELVAIAEKIINTRQNKQ